MQVTIHGKYLEHANIDNENSLYLIFNNINGYINESNGDKYLIFVSTDKNKEILEKQTKLWNEIKNQIKTIYGVEPFKYKKDFIKRSRSLDLFYKKATNIIHKFIYMNAGMNL